MKQQNNTPSSAGITAKVHIEHVSYRSAAWRELWRQIFIAVAEELDRMDAERAEAETAPDGPNGDVGC